MVVNVVVVFVLVVVVVMVVMVVIRGDGMSLRITNASHSGRYAYMFLLRGGCITYRRYTVR